MMYLIHEVETLTYMQVLQGLQRLPIDKRKRL